MISLGHLAAIYVAFFFLVLSPGPATLGVTSLSAAAGRTSGLVFAGGLAIGLTVWGIVAATGLGAVLKASPRVFAILELAGGLYLFWLAYEAVLSATRPMVPEPDGEGPDPAGPVHLLVRGIVLNLSNPESALAWTAALAIGISAQDSSASVVVATLGCIAIGAAVYAAYAVVFSVPVVMEGYARFRRWVQAVVGGLFALAGVALIASAVAGF